MKKNILIILSCICAIVILGAPAPQPNRLRPIPKNSPSLTPLKTKIKQSSMEVTNYVLIDEHFDNVKDGTESEPSETPLMSNEEFYSGRGISQKIIDGGTWTSSLAYPAGGTVALMSLPNASAYLNTPISDYSGEITVTFKAKPLIYNGEKKSYVTVMPYVGDFRMPNDAKYSKITDMSFNLYASDENWTEIEMKFKNYSANQDGFISIACDLGTAVLIDDLKITTSPTFIADPILKPAEFGTNSVTACWNPVRRAFNYYLRLYKKIEAGTGDVTIDEDFDEILSDGSNLPEGWTFNVSELTISENGGFDGTSGIVLRNGETIETPKNGAKYRNASVWLKSYYPSKEAEEADNNAMVAIDVLLDGTWYPFASYYMNMLTDMPAEDDMLTLAELYYSTFADKYDSIRIRISDSNCPEAYVVADHFYIETGEPVSYELIEDKDGNEYSIIEDDHFELNFDSSDKNYPYHGLSKECDYAYSLQSHYLFERSEWVFAELSGVYTPELNKPEETTDGYKVSWSPVYAANMYRIDNYGVRTLMNDVNDCFVFEEYFNKTESPTTSPLYPDEIGNTEISDLSNYSDLPGWGGRNNIFVNGMLGFSGGSIITPLIYLPNAETATVKIVYYATPSNILIMTDTEGNTYYNECTGASDMNITEAEFTVPAGKKPCEFTLSSYYNMPVLIDEFTVTQNAKAGNRVYSYIGSSFEESPITEHTFTDAEETGFTGFAYCVSALRDTPAGMLYSTPSNFRLSGESEMIEGISEVELPEVDTNAEVIGYYSVDGTLLDTPIKGINIVKMSNGSVRKVIVK